MTKELSALQGFEMSIARGAVVECAVRALIATHPDPGRVEAVFNQLLGQFQAHTAGQEPTHAAAIRAAAAKLFESPVAP